MRRAILTLVERLCPLDPLEAEHRATTLRWIESGADLFRTAKPATPPQHLVSYFVVVDGPRRRVLLVDHVKAQKWLPTGGHVDPGEHPRDTVVREAREELGLEACFVVDDPLFVTVTPTVGLTAGHTDVCLWYALHADSQGAVPPGGDEFTEARWFSFAEVAAMPIERLDPQMHRFLARLWERFG